MVEKVSRISVNIKGANIETKEQDINLLATNGNMNIESTQDKEYSNTEGTNYSVGGTMSYGESEDFSDVVKNNYTTIIAGSNKGSNGKVSVNTNDLNLVGINEETKDNLRLQEQKDNGNIKGNITKTILEEKNKHDSHAYNISYSLPISIDTGLGIGDAVNDLLSDLVSKTGDNKIANYFDSISKEYQKGFGDNNDNNTTINPDQGNINTQMPVQVGDWLGSLMNITIQYQNENGLDFTASPASVMKAGNITLESMDIAYNIISGLNPIRITYYGSRAMSDEANGSISETERKKAHERAAEAYGNYVGNPISGGIIRIVGETGQFFIYTTQDIYNRIVNGKPGPYQPYKFSEENGGLLDSLNDILNVINGANGNYKYFPNQGAVDIYNDQDYRKFIDNGNKW